MAVRPYGALILATSLATLGYLATGLMGEAPIVAGLAGVGAGGAAVIGLALLLGKT